MYQTVQDSYNLTRLATAKGYPERFQLQDEDTDWDVDIEYLPTQYESDILNGAAWADAEYSRELVEARLLPGDSVVFGDDNMPLNPHGRSGIAERGLFGRYGPQYIGLVAIRKNEDEVLTVFHKESGMRALPGGYIEPGEGLIEGALRELTEEAIPGLKRNEARQVGDLFFVPDPKTTDNAWLMAGIVEVSLIDHAEIVTDGVEVENASFEKIEKVLPELFPAHAHALRMVLNQVEV